MNNKMGITVRIDDHLHFVSLRKLGLFYIVLDLNRYGFENRFCRNLFLKYLNS